MKRKWVIAGFFYLWCLGGSATAQTPPEERPPIIPPEILSRVSNGYLNTTIGGQNVTKKALPFFVSPEDHAPRWAAIDQYFMHRFGISSVLSHHFWPQAVILHSTEGESEASAFNTFANPSDTYLGGVWTTFVIDAEGSIYQYSPLDKLSKGQAGVNDLALGIEIVGTASTYGGSQRLNPGSIAHRYESGNAKQIQAVTDLTQTLQHLLDIPTARVFSHEEVAHIQGLSGQNPDYDWLKQNIRDQVYLGKKPLLNGSGNPTRTYGYLEPYGRTDPGADVMTFVRENLR
jgi:hypothetical protein